MPSEQATRVSQLLASAIESHRRGDLKTAMSGYQKILVITPRNSVATQLLGTGYMQLNNFEESRVFLNSAIKLNPDYGEAYHNLARLDEVEHDLEASEKNYRRAIALMPTNTDSIFSLANVLNAKGDLLESEKWYRRTIELNPNYAAAHRQLARLLDHDSLDSDIRAMEELFEHGSTSTSSKMHLAFGLGKCFEDMQQYERAMMFFDVANRLMRDQLRFDINNWDKEIDKNIETFTPDLFARFAESGDVNARPLFILGMPRSGTSLIEQILASHSAVFGGGELQNLNIAVMANMDVSAYHRNVFQLDPLQLQKMAEHYLNAISALSENASIISDKKPDNFKLIGMIKLMFPNARVIHCCRDPLDTCLSLFKNHFSDRGPFYSYSQSELGQYYLGYQRLMTHWHSVLPGFIHDVSYERLVHDPESGIRELLQTCDLAFEPGCLEFHHSKRAVQTASAVQVRKPIYSKSVLLSQQYGAGLDDLKQALGLGV
ncbi:MAG: tetratricopeptide (TPR) repeat protein [Granulosicoccus sp.]